jgi:hypothetical protein
VTRWYLAFAAFAAALAVASGQPIERCWGTWAAIGYATVAAGAPGVGGRARLRGWLRWGYYAYPLALLGWLSLSAPPGRRSYSSERALATPPASAVASSGGASTGAEAVPAPG